jgi:hypothetical protein
MKAKAKAQKALNVAGPAKRVTAKPSAKKPKQEPATHPVPAVRVSYDALVGLIGKGVGDPAVKAVLATAGKVRDTGSHVLAYEAGFEFSLGRSPDEQLDTRPLVVLFLHAGHGKKQRRFAALPPPFVFGDRASVLEVAPPPAYGLSPTFTRKKGLLPLDVDVKGDGWKIGKREITANYRDGFVRTYTVR